MKDGMGKRWGKVVGKDGIKMKGSLLEESGFDVFDAGAVAIGLVVATCPLPRAVDRIFG